MPFVRTPVTRAAAAAALVVALAACTTPPPDTGAAGAREELARNVVLVLGAGLGGPQRDFLRLALAGPSGQLAMDRLDVAGSVDSTPAEGPVTDSAAAATALATGVRTVPGAAGVGVGGEPLPTVLELARDAGRATGVVTTAEVTDATPAAFAAHLAPVAGGGGEVARQYLEDTRLDVVLGGGAARWTGLLGPAAAAGYTTVTDAAQLRSASADRLLGLFADGPLVGPGPGPYAPAVPLADMTRAALAALDRRGAGFFLLVEEAGIDTAARSGDGAQLLEAGRGLEGAVQAALEFQAGHPDTLIVVAADHETGGMTVGTGVAGTAPAGADGPFPVADSDRQLWITWRSDGPTAARVPVTAGGPGAEAFEADLLNTDVFPALLQAMGIGS